MKYQRNDNGLDFAEIVFIPFLCNFSAVFNYEFMKTINKSKNYVINIPFTNLLLKIFLKENKNEKKNKHYCKTILVSRSVLNLNNLNILH